MIKFANLLKLNCDFFNMSTGVSSAVALSEGTFFTTFFVISSETVWKENFMFILTFCFILSILGCLGNLTIICLILSWLLKYLSIYSKRFSESVDGSKYILKDSIV